MKVPILKLGKILHASIPEDMGDEDALNFMEHVLNKAQRTEANGIVIDISGLDVVDSFMARLINDTAKMLRLLGLEVMLCGMNPFVAMTLVEMGRELIGVKTALNMERGAALINKILAARA